MECPGWLKEKDYGRATDVNSWIKLANQNEGGDHEETDRLQYMNDFKVEEKADQYRSAFREEQKAKRKAKIQQEN